ncbi:Imm26 family immunity protein [Sediminitomix flava]|uniref:Uncharacterized protein n=1 Tax=Sediminitomix flava TaxID=379075 RepID=A0A315ZD47_SEDFL|nr:hypothetical protein [Sediminitomix flava]PWJ30136.1 hypothetical protein BC781_1291 [Sediminitomix flava]
MSTAKNLKNGAVFEVELDGGIGFGYVKMLFSDQLGHEIEFDHFIIKIYNIYSDTSLKKDFTPSLFETDDLITSPPNMFFRPVLRGRDSWKYIGESELTEEDFILPDYIGGRGFTDTKDDVRSRIESGGQESIIHNFMNKRMYSRDFNDIKHLGFWRSQCSEAINRFLSIYWMNEKGMNPYEYYKKYRGQVGKKTEVKYFALENGFNLFEEMTKEFQALKKGQRLRALALEEYKPVKK